MEQYPGADSPFIQFSAVHLVPKVFQICSMSVPVQYRRIGMKARRSPLNEHAPELTQQERKSEENAWICRSAARGTNFA